MLRKLMIALIAISAIGVTLGATDADARGGWHGGHGGWHGGGYRGGWGYRGGYWGPRFYGGYYGYPAYAYPAAGYGCYQTRRVYTPYGIRYRRIWVCG